MTAQDNHDSQTESRMITIGEGAAPNYTNHLIPVNCSQIEMQTLERSNTDRVHCEMNVNTMVESKIHDSISIATDSLLILGWNSQ